MTIHHILDGKIQVYRRNRSPFWHCSASMKGRQYRVSTKEEGLAQAKEVAEEWYLELRGKSRAGILKKREKTFEQAAYLFLKEYAVITEGQRSQRWIDGYRHRLRLHLIPFFGTLGVSEVTPGKVQEYRVHRITNAPKGNPPARSTIHDEIVTIRQVLKTAIRHEWLAHLPNLSPPYRTQGKITHRPWFSPEEYKKLYEATREYAKQAANRHRWNAEQVHDFVLFLANTGLRPDEAKNLQHRDVAIASDGTPNGQILEIEVRGKRGIGYCKSMPGAVRPYQRLLNRPRPLTANERKKAKSEGMELASTMPAPTDPVFPGNHIKLFNNLLARSGLKFDRDNNPRTAYSLRHTYICMRLTGLPPFLKTS